MSSENKREPERSALPREDHTVSLRWVKPPRQDRSKDTQDRLIDAAQRLLARGRSWADITVAELVKEAGASVGAFYNRFRDKDALLHVLQIELYKEGEATAAQAASLGAAVSIPLPALIRAFVTLAASTYRQQFWLRRALFVQQCHDEQFRDRAIALTRLTCDGMTNVLATRYPTHARAKLALVVEIAHRIVYGLLDQNLLYHDRATGHVIDDGVLVEELTTAVVVYLEHRLAS